MIRALLVDDDVELAKLLSTYLSSHDVTVVHAPSGEQGLAKLAAESFDVVLLDVMMPGMDGFEVCRRIRAQGSLPVVMLTARGDDADRITGLEIGADDYLPKPFNPRELLARLRAVLRRTQRGPGDERIVVGELEISTGDQTVRRAGVPVTLTSFEYRVLIALARRAGETVAREELATLVKGGAYDPQVDRSLDVHISHLRQKLEKEAKEPKLIKTVRGVGYVLLRAP
jgi:DNA-binding response OmpR family regulator